jgi:hypothetical protein
LLAKVSMGAIGFAIVAALWPQVVAWPLAVLAAWVGLAWLAKARALYGQGRRAAAAPSVATPPNEGGGGGA